RRDAPEQRAQRHVAALLQQLALQHADLGRGGGAGDVGDRAREARLEQAARRVDELPVELPEALDAALVLGAVEAAQQRVRVGRAREPRRVEGAVEGRAGGLRVERAGLARGGERL